MKKYAIYILILAITFCAILNPGLAFGKTVAQLQAEKTSLQETISKMRKNIEESRANQNEIEAEIGELDIKLMEEQAELDLIEAELADAETRLAEAEEKLADATEKKEIHLGAFKSRIKFMYEEGSVGYLKVILQSNGIMDFLTRIQYVKDIMTYDNEIFQVLKENERIIKEQTEAIAKEKDAITLLAEDQRAKTDVLVAAVSEKELLLAKYESDEKKYKSLLSSTEKASAEVERLIQNALSSSSASGSTVTYSGGRFEWPVPGRSYISSGYGYRKRPIGSGSEFHTGYDIPAPYGSNIVAAEAGTVITSGYINGYGYTVIINHGSGITTLYGHNSSLIVSVGQTVSRGQVIAKAGSTGNSTGNHCHFEVRVNGKHVNPKEYLGV